MSDISIPPPDEGQPQRPQKGHGERLTRLQERAISALLTSPNYSVAAQAVGVHPNTLRLWGRLPCFSAAFQQARQELLAATVNRLQNAAHTAIAALVQELNSEDPSTRVRVADLILNHMRSSSESLLLADRVSVLEKALKQRQGARTR